MRFTSPLLPGTLVKRYKRFLADVELDNGEVITAHCANPGSMLGLNIPGMRVWLSRSDNPKRKLQYSWELLQLDEAMIGINTSHPNKIALEAIRAGKVKELSGYDSARPEVKYGQSSRIDILLSPQAGLTVMLRLKMFISYANPATSNFRFGDDPRSKAFARIVPYG